VSLPSNRTAPLTVYAPASIGNLSVGFDSLGLALAPENGQLLGDLVQLQAFADDEFDADWQLELDGPFAAALPANPEDNIVIQCCRAYQEAAAERDIEVQPMKVLLSKRLPIGSGLGSSASSIVAGLEALNRWHGHLLDSRQLFRLMAQMEGDISGEIHLDNVAPCLYGGLRLCPPGSQHEFALPWPGAWRAVVCWPGTQLVTRAPRWLPAH
jgi:homoserine kinase